MNIYRLDDDPDRFQCLDIPDDKELERISALTSHYEAKSVKASWPTQGWNYRVRTRPGSSESLPTSCHVANPRIRS